MWLLAILVLADSSWSRVVSVAPAETLEVTVVGEGPAIVLIPGLFGSAFGFRNLIPLLAAPGRQVVVVEPLGVGSSARPERADYSLGAQAARIAAVLDTLNLRGVVVVAHSLGAGMALRLAYQRPDLVAALVSLDGGPAETVATPGLRMAAQAAPWVKLLGGVSLVRKKIRASLIKASGDSSWVTDSVVEGYTAAAARDLDGTLKAYLRMAEARERERLAPHLAEIRCPVRLVVGGAEHPEVLRDRDIELMTARIARISVDTLPGAGHHLHEEQPAAVAGMVERAVADAGAVP